VRHISGGITGISNHKEAQIKWFLTSHIRAHAIAFFAKGLLPNSLTVTTLHKEDTIITTTKDEIDILMIF